MDDRAFDAIARSIAGGHSRRRVVAGLAASLGLLLTPRAGHSALGQSDTGAGEDCRCNPECAEGYYCLHSTEYGSDVCTCNRDRIPPNANAPTGAESGDGAERFCSDCGGRCFSGQRCMHKGCYCFYPNKPSPQPTTIETDLDGNVVTAITSGSPGVILVVEQECPDATACLNTLLFAEDGAAAPFLTATTKTTPKGKTSLRFVGDGVDYAASFDPANGESVTAPNAGLVLPEEVAARVAPLTPALTALVGSAVVASAGVFCPPGPRRPDLPASAGAAAPSPDDQCSAACQHGLAGVVEACCAGSTAFACLLCAAAAASGKKGKKGYITEKGGNAMPAPDPATTGGVEATGTPPTDDSAKATLGPPTPSPTNPKPPPVDAPTGPSTCGADELACGGRCIPAAECPVASCCLSPESCACVCPDCGPHGAFDPAACRCACNADARPCAEGCMSHAQCPPEACCLSAETCLCTCPECGPNSTIDPATCGCTCGLTGCPPNFVLDAASCACVCGQAACPPNFVLDQASCTCACVVQECPANFVFDEASCACICAAQCPPPFVVDAAACACFCALEGCPPGFGLDPASCTCFCQEVACAEGQVFDPAICACVGSGAAGAVEGSG